MCDFLVNQCVRHCPLQTCPICQQRALPDDPKVLFKIVLEELCFEIYQTQTMGKATKLSKTKNTVKPVYNSHLGKWQGDRYIQGDHYILVNCAENVRQLKILGSYPVTVIYRLTAIYRFDCNRNITKQIQKEKLMVKLKVD